MEIVLYILIAFSIGISFFTSHLISVVINDYKEEIKQKDLEINKLKNEINFLKDNFDIKDK